MQKLKLSQVFFSLVIYFTQTRASPGTGAPTLAPLIFARPVIPSHTKPFSHPIRILPFCTLHGSRSLAVCTSVCAGRAEVMAAKVPATMAVMQSLVKDNMINCLLAEYCVVKDYSRIKVSIL
ncbi:hypothetical protein BDF19DRAFT_451739 [Syncephalis fuscata]|nr:hypothetical protein BDF19DRAFT_451739 [Syncephalis fuscata]